MLGRDLLSRHNFLFNCSPSESATVKLRLKQIVSVPPQSAMCMTVKIDQPLCDGGEYLFVGQLSNNVDICDLLIRPFTAIGCMQSPYFLHLVIKVLGGLDGVHVYADYILLTIQSAEECHQLLHTVLDRLRAVGLKLAPGKCCMFQTGVVCASSFIARCTDAPSTCSTPIRCLDRTNRGPATNRRLSS